jgi:hypothetical protein
MPHLTFFSETDALLTGGKARKVTYKGTTYTIGPATRSDAKNKKWKRTVTWDGGKRKKTINYGYSGMEDYTQHKDEKRRKNFRARSGGIRDKNGELTKDNPLSANYYNRRDTW